MNGDGGEYYMAKAIMAFKNNPDKEFVGLSRTEIENRVKKQSRHLTSRKHTFTLKDGRRIKFSVTNKNIEHYISDAGGRAKGVLNISDIKNLDKSFSHAVHVSSAGDVKKRSGGVKFHYFETSINGKTIYLNGKEDKKKKKNEIYSITKEIK